MDVLVTHCAGLDVHKKNITACRMIRDPTGKKLRGCWSCRPLARSHWSCWLAAAGVTHVAMESTGEYWKPVYNLLEGTCTVLLVNAAHVKNVPGRKTDKADARWLAKLLRYGLLQASFIPPAGQRDLRDLTRYRTHTGPGTQPRSQPRPRRARSGLVSSWPRSRALLWVSRDARCWRP